MSPTDEEEDVIAEGGLTLRGAKPKIKAAAQQASKPEPQIANAKTVKKWYAEYQAVTPEDWKKIRAWHPRTRCENGCGRRAAKGFNT